MSAPGGRGMKRSLLDAAAVVSYRLMPAPVSPQKAEVYLIYPLRYPRWRWPPLRGSSHTVCTLPNPRRRQEAPPRPERQSVRHVACPCYFRYSALPNLPENMKICLVHSLLQFFSQTHNDPPVHRLCPPRASVTCSRRRVGGRSK